MIEVDYFCMVFISFNFFYFVHCLFLFCVYMVDTIFSRAQFPFATCFFLT